MTTGDFFALPAKPENGAYRHPTPRRFATAPEGAHPLRSPWKGEESAAGGLRKSNCSRWCVRRPHHEHYTGFFVKGGAGIDITMNTSVNGHAGSSWLGTKTWENVRNWKLEFTVASKMGRKRSQLETSRVCSCTMVDRGLVV